MKQSSDKRYVSYFRVSTQHQGLNGLGMDAQRESVRRFLDGKEAIAEFSEVETGKRRDRPELMKALDQCRKEGATLLIAKLDRLARNASFLLGLRDSGVEFVCCDHPQANRLTIGILAVIAEHEREMISMRTIEGLAAAKRRGVKLGNPNPGEALKAAQTARTNVKRAYLEQVVPIVKEIQGANMTSLRKIAKCLNARGVKAINGGKFYPQTVAALLKAIG